MLENIWYNHFYLKWTEFTIWTEFCSNCVFPGFPVVNWNKFTISCEFGQLQVKWWYHLFSGIKMEECMGSELSGIFWVKLFAKNIVLGSWESILSIRRLGTPFNLHKAHRGDLFCKAYSLQVYSREFLYMHFQEFHSMKLAFSQIKELVLLITKQLIINVIISQSDW